MEVTTGELLDADERADAPETEVLDRLRDRRLLEAVKELKGDQQECIVLRFLQGLSLAETAAVLGRNENAVKQLQFRAVRALHRLLDGDLDDDLAATWAASAVISRSRDQRVTGRPTGRCSGGEQTSACERGWRRCR